MEKTYLLMLAILGSFLPTGESIGISVPQVCYPRYGCFNQFPPFQNILMKLPQNPEIINTQYFLYTRLNRELHSEQIIDDNDKGKLDNSYFNITRRTILICHGWTEYSAGYYDWGYRLKDALLDKGDFNIILVDWAVGANQDYGQSAGNTRLVGVQVGELINFIILNNGNDPHLADNFYFIGFSLGAQVAGYTGTYLQDKYGMKLGRITGLDPAGPCYTATADPVHLDKSDAKYVDIIHANMPVIGTTDHVGHTEFYPDGGAVHPGCAPDPTDVVFTVGCNHLRATEFFIKTVDKSCKDPWVGHPCSSYSWYMLGFCNGCGDEGCPTMGYDAEETKIEGEFYLQADAWNVLCPKS